MVSKKIIVAHLNLNALDGLSSKFERGKVFAIKNFILHFNPEINLFDRKSIGTWPYLYVLDKLFCRMCYTLSSNLEISNN